MKQKSSSQPKPYQCIVAHYEKCLHDHGDNHKGVDWPNRKDALVRYRVMLDIVPGRLDRRFSVLDFGCGLSHMYAYIKSRKIDNVQYAGLDISEEFIARARKKYPENAYYCMDILENAHDLPDFDYIILNGVLTEKADLTFEQMLYYTKRIITAVFSKASIGVAFNVMSKDVDWERDDLFHLPFDMLSAFLVNELKARFMFRKDYGLYEYTTYLFKGENGWQR